MIMTIGHNSAHFGMGMNFADNVQANLGYAIAQTAHIEAQVYRFRYPELNYAELVPVDFSAGEWAKTVTYFSLDGAARANWINGNGKDIPVADFNTQRYETAVYMAGIGYSYGWEEINQARALGIPLDVEKARIARRGYEEMVYRIATIGDAAKGFQGLFNTSGVPQAAVPNDGAASSPLWSAKTPDQIVRDLNSALIAMQSATGTVEMADTLILPVERMQSLASTARSSTSDTTILEFFERTNIYTASTGRRLTIRGVRDLLTRGSGSTARLIAYRRAPDVLKLHVPMPHRFLPVQQDILQFVVPGVFRLGGLDVRLPQAIRYLDGF
jgi:hypothetical protein